MTPVMVADNGTRLSIPERTNGTAFEPIHVEPRDRSQDWFWTPAWQEREREADADIRSGRVTTFDDIDSFLDAMDALREP